MSFKTYYGRSSVQSNKYKSKMHILIGQKSLKLLDILRNDICEIT